MSRSLCRIPAKTHFSIIRYPATFMGSWIASSSNNNLNDNNVSNNKFGIYLKNSTDNRLSGNWANSNTRHGIYLGFFQE